MFKHLILRILANGLALYLAQRFVAGFVLHGGWREYLLAGLALALLNMLVRPVLKLIAFPLIILTLGLFTLVINAGMLWATDYLFGFLAISGLWALIWGTLIVSIVNILFHTY